jgi:hypothetical protein
MEHMVGSMDQVMNLLSETHRRIPEPILGLLTRQVCCQSAISRLTAQIISALLYLKQELGVMHRGQSADYLCCIIIFS